ncbi:MAG: RIP metalloprotease RseP [Alphaproteobacteria bacterium]|nr:RIP metalloprotease RseP [Alphaproteobacteria bacterium]
MMTFFYYLISFLVIINVIVIVHELGHYIAAKKIGVKIVKFSVGMGPEIWGFDDKEGTHWCFSWLPIGGYVMTLGDADPSSSTEDTEGYEKLSEEDKKRSIISKSNWEKMLFAFGGPLANYVYAFVVVFLMAFFYGVPKYEPVVGEVLKNSAAERAGMLAGDRVVSVDGQKVEKYRDILVHLSMSEQDDASFLIEREGKLLSINVTPEITIKKKIIGGDKKTKLFGIKSKSPVFEKLSFIGSIKRAIADCVSASKEMCLVFKKLFAGQRSLNDFGGVVYMASVAGDLTKTGNIAMLIMFTVTLSLNLGFINLFPLPVLDGGRILICFLEQITRRKFNEKFEEYIMVACAIFLIFLMFLTTINDILRIEVVDKFVSKLLG